MDIAIVGCGMIADAHIQEIMKIENTKIVAVCDSEILMAEQLSERYQISTTYCSMDEMLNENHIDVVHILTPPSTHYELASRALDKGCHVLLEKPFTVYASEAKDLIEKSKKANRKITVNHFHSFSPPQMKLKEIVNSGKLGKITHIEGHYGYRMDGPVPQSLLQDSNGWIYGLPGRVIQNNISHLLCTIVDVLPDDSFKTFAIGKAFGDVAKKFKSNNIHDELRAIIVGESITAYATFSSNIGPAQQFMKVYGTENTLSVDYESKTLSFSPKSKLPGAFGKLANPIHSSWFFLSGGMLNIVKFLKSDFHYYGGAKLLFREFYSCIKNDSEVPIPYTDIVNVAQITEDIVNSMNNQYSSSSY